MQHRTLLAATSLAALAGAPAAQGGAIQSPGMPSGPSSGQSLQFASEFNPAIGLVLDATADWTDPDDPDAEGGLNLDLRSAELSFNAWIDPKAWAFANVVFAEDAVELEEGAVVFQGLGGDATLKAGRFFVDFGKQMQAHEHELRTFERPAVLRTFLGSELAGQGLQYDNWFSAGDKTVVRYSFGVFESLLGEGGGEADEPGAPVAFSGERRDFDELSFTGRFTGLTEVGDYGTFQFGASARLVSDFSFASEELDLEVAGLSNTVYGVDLTYGRTDDTGTKGWAAGLEYLVQDGDLSAEVGTGGAEGSAIEILDGSVAGYYAWGDYRLDAHNNLGLQFSNVQLPEVGEPELQEFDLYYARHLSEFQRLRFSVTLVDDEAFGDDTRLSIQYTNILGAHSHGVSW